MNDINSVIKTVMKDNNFTQADLARLFSVSPQAINGKFKRGSWDLSEVIKVLDAMDCKLIIQSGSIKQYNFN